MVRPVRTLGQGAAGSANAISDPFHAASAGEAGCVMPDSDEDWRIDDGGAEPDSVDDLMDGLGLKVFLCRIVGSTRDFRNRETF